MNSNHEAEKEVLGTILNYPQIIWGPAAGTQFKYFESAHNREVFSAIHAAASEGQEPDFIEVERRLNPNLHGYLTSLKTLQLKQRGFRNRLDQIEDHWFRKEVNILAQQTIAEAKTGDPRGVIGKYAELLSSLAISQGAGNGPRLLGEILGESKAEYDKRKNQPDTIGTPTGYIVHDLLRRGLRPFRYTIIAARPSVGKTTFAVNCLINASQQPNLPLVIAFSVEMRTLSIVDRITCAEARVDTEKFAIAKLTPEEEQACEEARQRLTSSRFYLEDGKEAGSAHINLTLERIHILTRQLINKEKAWRVANSKSPDFLTIVLIDYLQNLHSDDPAIENAPDKTRVTKISNSLKGLVNATGIHLIAISQLNREGDEEPTMRHLAASGDLEYDADDIVLMHAKKENPMITHFNLAKHREGPLGKWELQFIKPFSLFQNPGDVPLPEVNSG